MNGRDHDSSAPKAPTDIGAAYDPIHATHPAVLVHDVDLDTFEHAWTDCETRCPQCRAGVPDARGTSPFEQRWVHFTCGDVIELEQSAG